MIDAVLSYHLNPATCGVAKFNHELAGRLGVRVLPLDSSDYTHPLLSFKPSELSDITFAVTTPYSVFLHGFDEKFGSLVRFAERVYAGNPEIADAIRPHRPDVITAFCPSTVTGNPHRGKYRVLVFGMAHKLLLPKFEELKRVLDTEHPDYTVELSTAVHEGTPWDTALTESVEAMRGIFGDKLRVLGYLGDDALAKELREVDAVAAFYQPAFRANNTSAWAALDAGKPLYTNTDEYSPTLDSRAHSWDKLLEMIRA